jgi:hypothetical protein
MSVKRGLYSNIHAKRERIKAGSNERIRKVPAARAHPLQRLSNSSARTAKRKS